MSVSRKYFLSLVLVASASASFGQSAESFSSSSQVPPVRTDVPAGERVHSYDPLLDLPPLPHRKVALTGGAIVKVDHVSNQLVLRPFGGKRQLHVDYDMRTAIYRDEKPGSGQDLHSGDRVYVDTILNGSRVFAKSIHIETSASSGNGTGQILDYDANSNQVTIRDELSEQSVHFKLSPSTVIHHGSEARVAADLKAGSLVALTFSDQQGRAVVSDISLLAEPGSEFSFFGKLTFVDLSQRIVAIANETDGKSYEIHLASIPRSLLSSLHEGTEVGVSAVFDGKQYTARNVTAAAKHEE
jgi:hypothetical protein